MANQENVSAAEAAPYREFGKAVLRQVGQTMFGLEAVTQLSLMALYSNGHVLLEGNPGLGKTEFVKTLGRTLSLPFGRIQFTPDLLPSDITGTKLPSVDRREFRFNPGPVFTSLLLADEVNRATPKTQSAMLEAMAERQVTVLGEQWKIMPREQVLDEVAARAAEPGRPQVSANGQSRPAWPFMVLATQNPIDQEGTYGLPEAQADRFMFKLLMPTPGRETLRAILGKDAGTGSVKQVAGENVYRDVAPPSVDSRLAALQVHAALHLLIRQVQTLSQLEQHLGNLLLATNREWDGLQEVSSSARARLAALAELTPYGLGPRAATALMLGAKAWALLFQADGKPIADGRALAAVIGPALRHRLKVDYDWEDRYLQLNASSAGQKGGTDELRRLGLLDELIARAKEPAAARGRRGMGDSKNRPWHASPTHDLFLMDWCLLTAPDRHDYAVQITEAFRSASQPGSAGA